ncbi:MAG: 1-deoxy-D-xylulose-5-phosphate synthase [Planctomycetota bacterium]
MEKIDKPEDLRSLTSEALVRLADEIRQLIIDSVGKNGGHLASNLGVVELTIAMHHAFDFHKDFLLWDVGHQCYAHKILTGRRKGFERLRRSDGISGFPSPAESPCDLFEVGHAGTAVGTALGMALAAQNIGIQNKIVALVGDASIFNGLSFEALNNLSLVKRQLLIVLNDNSMAIDVTQGALAKFLAKIRLSHTYEDMRRITSSILEHLPVIGKPVDGAIEKIKKSIRMALSPSQLFESLNIPYFGPVNGHDIDSLIKLFNAIAHLEYPAILHVYTKKGQGFRPADDDPRRFHSTGPFHISANTDVIEVNSKGRTFTDAFSDAVVQLAEKDQRIIGITAAMSDGTGLVKFRDKFRDRYFDVGIAESAAVDIAAGIAKKNLRPLVCIYSTFLQRSYDQIFQEVALQDLPVIFCIDRAGLVGADGPTHHGMMDIAFLRTLPNMVLISPSDETELKAALEFALNLNHPVAIRYPKDTLPVWDSNMTFSTQPFRLGKSIYVQQTDQPKAVVVAYGSILAEVVKAANILHVGGINIDIINARFAKPLDQQIISLLARQICVITLEDHYLHGGFGSAVLEQAAKDLKTIQAKVICLAAPDGFIERNSRSAQMAQAGIDANAVVEKIRSL